MMNRMRAWPLLGRAAFLFAVAVSSWLIRYWVRVSTDSLVVRAAVDVVVLVVLGWLWLAFFRGLLRESEDEAKRNPKPW